MTRFLAALLLCVSPSAFAAPSGALTGLATTGAGLVGSTAGYFGGFAGWTASEYALTDQSCEGATDNCGLGPLFRGLLVGGPLGSAAMGFAASGVTHHLVSGSGDGKVLAAGAGTAAGGILVGSVGLVMLGEGNSRGGAAVYSLGMGTAMVATPIVMGVVSGHHPREVDGVARGPRVDRVGTLAVEEGGGLVVGGTF